MNARLASNLESGCVLAKASEENEAAYDATMENMDEERGLTGLTQTNAFDQVHRMIKSAKRVAKLYLSDCAKYDHYVGKYDKVKNGMEKAFIRVNRLGGDYDGPQEFREPSV